MSIVETVCTICGGVSFTNRSVLWQTLIDDWQLAPIEVEYVNRQQGRCCNSCGANLRSIALANALRSVLGSTDTLATLIASHHIKDTRILELNEAGTLSPLLRQLPGHVFGSYPLVDMHHLPYADESFDVLIHSDTLEHVSDPIHALAECRRVLKPGGALCYTVPTITERLSRARVGLPKSYHGNPEETPEDFVVHTEFGADMWTYPAQAGFAEITIFAVEFPAALALAAVR